MGDLTQPGSDEPVGVRVAGRRCPRGDAELGVDVAHVTVDSPDAQDEALGNLPVGLPGGEQAKHFELALGQSPRIVGAAEAAGPVDPGEVSGRSQADVGLPCCLELQPRALLVPEGAAAEADQLSRAGALIRSLEPLPELTGPAQRGKRLARISRG